MIVSAAALEDGYTPETVIPAPDVLTLPNSTRDDWRTSTAASCNPAERADADRRADHLLQHRLRPARHRPRRGRGPGDGRGVRHGRRELRRSRCRSSASSIGDIENDAALGPDLDRPADVRMTPLQAAMIAAAVANDGTLMTALPGRPGAGPRPLRHRRDRPRGVQPSRSPTEVAEPAHRDDAQRRRERLRPAPRRSTASRSPARPGRRRTPDAPDHNWFIGFAPADDPTDRRRRLRRQRRRHRRRRLRTDRPRGDRRPTSTGRGTDGAVHRQPAGRPLRDHRPHRHRRHGRGLEGPRPGPRPDRRGQGAQAASTPATRASWPASATRPGTPPP